MSLAAFLAHARKQGLLDDVDRASEPAEPPSPRSDAEVKGPREADSPPVCERSPLGSAACRLNVRARADDPSLAQKTPCKKQQDEKEENAITEDKLAAFSAFARQQATSVREASALREATRQQRTATEKLKLEMEETQQTMRELQAAREKQIEMQEMMRELLQIETQSAAESEARGAGQPFVGRENKHTLYIITDTNVFIGPDSVAASGVADVHKFAQFPDTVVVVPLTVIQELDNMTKRARAFPNDKRVAALAFKAREATRFLGHHLCSAGAGGWIRAQRGHETAPLPWGQPQNNDERILQCVRYFTVLAPRRAVLVTEDKNLQVKANGFAGARASGVREAANGVHGPFFFGLGLGVHRPSSLASARAFGRAPAAPAPPAPRPPPPLPPPAEPAPPAAAKPSAPPVRPRLSRSLSPVRTRSRSRSRSRSPRRRERRHRHRHRRTRSSGSDGSESESDSEEGSRSRRRSRSRSRRHHRHHRRHSRSASRSRSRSRRHRHRHRRDGRREKHHGRSRRHHRTRRSSSSSSSSSTSSSPERMPALTPPAPPAAGCPPSK